MPKFIKPQMDVQNVNQNEDSSISSGEQDDTTIGECLEILDQASTASGDTGVFQMLASAVGWK